MNNTLNFHALDRRATLGALAVAAAALPLSGAFATTRQGSSAQALDDGSSELMAAYVVTHTSGRPTMFARANYFFLDRRQDVELQRDARLTVNGHELKEDPQASPSYIADVPARPTIEYELVRRPGQEPLSHTLDLPSLQFLSLPRVYQAGGGFHASLRAGPPTGPGVIEDGMFMRIFGPQGETWLQPTGRSTLSDLVLVPSQQSALPPGDYRARLVRQQRVSLRLISRSRAGFAVISHGLEFLLSVRP